MKKIVLFGAVLLGLNVSAQESIIDEIDYVFLEKLILIAKESNPQKKILEIQEKRSKSMVSAAKISYLDVLSVSYFYRPEDRYAYNPENPFVFNGFQLGVNLSPGTFFQKPSEIKQAKAEYEVAALENKRYEITLETEVKSRYYNYIFGLQQLKMRTSEAQDAKLSLESLRTRYESGEAELEEYNRVKQAGTQADLILAQSEIDYLKAKDALEEIIGRKINDVD